MKTKLTLTLLVISSICVSLIILELGVRLLPPPAKLFENYGNTYVCSSTMGWVGQPNLQSNIKREEYEHAINFNSQGMYDTEHDIKKAENSFRILWVGDSFAQTIQVLEPETAHQQLEIMLNERLGHSEQQFEVINLGVMGWSNAQALVQYRELGRQYQADLVLLHFFMGNDVNNNLPGHALTINGFNCYSPYFPICEDGQLDSQAWYHVPGLDPAWGHCAGFYREITNGLSTIQQNSFLFARLEPLLLSWKERRTYGNTFALPFAALYLPQESTEVSYGWAVTEGIIKQFNQEAQADNATFGVTIIGPREVVWLSLLNEAQRASFTQSNPEMATATVDRPNLRLQQFLTSENIPTLDLQAEMIHYMAETGADLYLPIDRHWTVEGNRVAAEMMYQWLVEQELVK